MIRGALPALYIESRLRRDQSTMVRSFAPFVFLIHLLVAGGASLAESRLERSLPEPVPHIEAQQDAACVPIHDELNCQICRALGRSSGVPSSQVTTPYPGGTACISLPPAQRWLAASGIARVLSARGPPLI